MLKFKNMLCVTFLSLFIIGCSDARLGRLDSLKEYQNESAEESVASPEKGDALIKELNEKLIEIEIPSYLRWSQTEGDYKNAKSLRRYVSQAIQLGLEKKDYLFVIKILDQMPNRAGRFVGYDIDPSMYGKFSQMYQDILNNDIEWPWDGVQELINNIGSKMIHQKKYLTAYRFYGDATLAWEPLRSNNAEKTRSILFHFGCQQDIAVWGEFTSATPQNDILGEAYPLIKMDDNFNIALARKNIMTSRTSPELQKNCPLNLFD